MVSATLARFERVVPLRGFVVTTAMLAAACDPLPLPPPPDLRPPPATASSQVAPVANSPSVEKKATTPMVSGRSVEAATPADVLARVELLRAEVAVLRRYMGRAATKPARLRVENAKPRLIHSQATALFESADQLAFELSRTAGAPLLPLDRDATPADVFRVVDRALGRVLTAKGALAIHENPSETSKPDSTTPTEAFHATVAAATEIDNLLQQRTSPAEIYRHVTHALHAGMAILTTAGTAPLPEEPEFEPNKVPSDVYRELLVAYDRAFALAKTQGIDLVKLRVTEVDAEKASSYDVRDLSVLLAEEMTFLHASWPQAKPAFAAHHPGLSFPSHVHQRARFLTMILERARGGPR